MTGALSLLVSVQASQISVFGDHGRNLVEDWKHPAECVFPFTYKNKRYNACTSAGTNEKDPFMWCAHNSIYASGKEGVTWEKCAEPWDVDMKNMTDYIGPNYAQKNVSKLDCIAPAKKVNGEMLA